MKTLLLCGLAALTALWAPTAHAHFTFTFAQVGNDVVVTGDGTLNLNGLTPGSTVTGEGSAFFPDLAILDINPSNANLPYYTGVTGTDSWGSGGYHQPTSASGDPLALINGSIELPANYVSGTLLADTATFGGQTFATLGFTPGTYIYTWSSDTLTVTSVVPEPSTWTAVLAGAGLLGLALRRHRARR